jgi:hypothetical protein
VRVSFFSCLNFLTTNIQSLLLHTLPNTLSVPPPTKSNSRMAGVVPVPGCTIQRGVIPVPGRFEA